jgi:hypothetical protein
VHTDSDGGGVEYLHDFGVIEVSDIELGEGAFVGHLLSFLSCEGAEPAALYEGPALSGEVLSDGFAG